MKKNIIYLLLLLPATFFSFFLTSSQVSAADYGMSISPPLLRVHIKPGKSITQAYKIENLGLSDKTLVVSIVPFSEADNFGNPLLNPKTSASWLSYFDLANSQIKLDRPFTISAGSFEQLVLSFTAPIDAPLKDIYATLMVSTYENTLGQTFQGTALRATIGSNLLITVSSEAFPNTILKIEDFSPVGSGFIKMGNLYFADSITPVKFNAMVNNEGNFLSETRGIFRVTTANNKPVHLEGILPVNVIAKSKRQLLNPQGQSFEFAPSLGRIGLHKVSLEIKTDNSNTTGTIEIFFFPLKLSLGLLLALIIVISIVKITSGRSPEEP